MAKYITKEGDTIDAIAFDYYGDTNNKIVEQIIDANYCLASLPVILPSGIHIELPERGKTAVVTNRKVKLWD
ncbi:tail protein X [Acinetobacter gerneri]|uniref:tail protein X n=1 Tax=Acinetobacter gerneri TaxID=202952 RepID=UPI003AF9F871